MRRAGIYTRISQDRDGEGLGVTRQLEDCEKLCAKLGWNVTGTYCDNDTSASSGKPRPEWQRLLRDIEDGIIDAVAVYHVDRLTRSPVELELVIDLADRHGIDLATVDGEIDLATPSGRMVARMLGAAARAEMERKGDRQKRQRQQAAEAGKVNGGGTRPYGYASDFVTIIEGEAEVIRECARRTLAGESLSSICRDLAERDVRTPSSKRIPEGRHWQPRTLRRMLASARISGRREHTPRSVRDTGTRPLLGEIVAAVAAWPGIISIEESDRLRSMLSDPGRVSAKRATGRTYLLSGILRCGRCGTGMCGRPKSGTPRYVCPNMPGTDACGGVATVAARTDDHVRDLVLLALEGGALAARLAEHDDIDPEIPAAIRADEERLVELAAEWAGGNLSRGEWRTAREIIDARLERNRGLLSRHTASAPVIDMVGTYDDLLVRWDGQNQSQRRAVVSAVLDHVDVNPADPSRKWDPDRFHPVFRV